MIRKVFAMVFVKPGTNRLILSLKDADTLSGALISAEGEMQKMGDDPSTFSLAVSSFLPVNQIQGYSEATAPEPEKKPETVTEVVIKEKKSDTTVKNKLMKKIIGEKDKELLNKISFVFTKNEVDFLIEEIKK